MVISSITAYSITIDNIWLPITTISVGIIINLVLRRKVKEIIADERDYQTSGTAARYTLTVITMVGAILTFIFMFNQQYFCICNMWISTSLQRNFHVHEKKIKL